MKFIRNIFLILTLKCRESSFLLTSSENKELDWSEKIALRMHVMVCHKCRHFKKHLSILNKIFQRYSSMDFCESEHLGKLSDEKKEQIKKKILEN